jgi:hypothetical protein
MYREAIIEPTADLNRLDELFIVLGPKQPAQGSDTNAPPINATPPQPVENAPVNTSH